MTDIFNLVAALDDHVVIAGNEVGAACVIGTHFQDCA